MLTKLKFHAYKPILASLLALTTLTVGCVSYRSYNQPTNAASAKAVLTSSACTQTWHSQLGRTAASPEFQINTATAAHTADNKLSDIGKDMPASFAPLVPIMQFLPSMLTLGAQDNHTLWSFNRVSLAEPAVTAGTSQTAGQMNGINPAKAVYTANAGAWVVPVGQSTPDFTIAPQPDGAPLDARSLQTDAASCD